MRPRLVAGRRWAAALTAGFCATLGTTIGCDSAEAPAARPAIHHVFLLLLENESYDVTFGPQSQAPYLAQTLVSQGALLQNYYGIGHSSLDNYVAMISGQAPNVSTQSDCGTYTTFALSQPALDANGQALGTGCVYPTMVPMIGDQLEAAQLTWRAYMEDMGNDPTKESATCGHPLIDSADQTNNSVPGDQYVSRHDPFVYFQHLIGDSARCATHVVNYSHLATDLASVGTTPNYVFITPNVCHDGHDTPCVDGEPGGLVSANLFLQQAIPAITNSAAFKKDGLLIITFDEGLDDSACCGERGLPGATQPPGWDGPGGGRLGAVVLSPFIKAGTVSTTPYNHYSMLRTVEDIFGLAHLGYAADSQLVTFGSDVFAKK